ncbi:hypothetical protein KY328_04015 [Candidatus Woesearchaeota archaeon]|nr:hypothetical protein [Candidatus Woesearchaeota archaeon]MBW3022063.1 hypothetical protein [Candidatus Woesearchaeota archaeon]
MQDTIEARAETVYKLFCTYMQDIVDFETERYRPLNEKMQRSVNALEEAGISTINLESRLGTVVILPEHKELEKLALYIAEWEHEHPFLAFLGSSPLGRLLGNHEFAYELYKNNNVLNMKLYEHLLRNAVQVFLENENPQTPGEYYVGPLVRASRTLGNRAGKFYGAWHRRDVVKSLRSHDKRFVVDTLEHKYKIDSFISKTLHLIASRISCETDPEETVEKTSEAMLEGIRNELDKPILVPCCEEAGTLVFERPCDEEQKSKQ